MGMGGNNRGGPVVWNGGQLVVVMDLNVLV